MRIKASELEGAALDWATAKAVRAEIDDELTHSRKVWAAWGDMSMPEHFHPSTNWSQGGPLIERFGVWLTLSMVTPHHWSAAATKGRLRAVNHSNDKPLIAAMRAIVAAELGDEVDIPDELVEIRHGHDA